MDALGLLAPLLTRSERRLRDVADPVVAKIQLLVGAFQHTPIESARVGLGHVTPRSRAERWSRGRLNNLVG